MELNCFYRKNLILVNKNFFIKTKSGFKKVKGILLKRNDKLVLFLHREKNKFIISDAITGKRLTAKHKSKNSAEKFLDKIIDKHNGAEFVRKKIDDNLKKGILSPRYNFVVKTS